MKLKLSRTVSGYLMPDTNAEEEEYDLTESEYNDFTMWFLKLYFDLNWNLKKDFNSVAKNEYALQKEKLQKSDSINKFLWSHDKLDAAIKQINLLWWVVDLLVDEEIKRNPDFANNEWIINSKAILENIKQILNK